MVYVLEELKENPAGHIFYRVLNNLSSRVVEKDPGSDYQKVSEYVPTKLTTCSQSLTDLIGLSCAITAFLMKPVPFQYPDQVFYQILSIESLVIYIIYGFYLVNLLMLVGRKVLRKPEVLCTNIFILLFVVQSALIEDNLGTAHRHKSVLLIVIALNLVLSRFSGNLEVPNTSAKGNHIES